MASAHNKRRQSRAYRADFWDYSFSVAYFVTINLLNRRPLFGTIRKGIITLSSLGKIAFHCWQKRFHERIIRNRRELENVRQAQRMRCACNVIMITLCRSAATYF
ncbi:MAG: hypothetical protein ACK4E0_13360 [Chitinophagaceae bacterium]